MLETLLLAAVLTGQVHPCDALLPVNPSLTVPVKAGFCATDQSVTAKLYIDGLVVWVGTPARVTGPNAEGLNYFEIPLTSVSKGGHFAQVDITSGAEPMEPGYAFTIVAPGQAKKPRIIK